MADLLPGSTRNAPITTKIGEEVVNLPSRSHRHQTVWATGTGAQTRFPLTWTPTDASQLAVYVNGSRKRPADRGTAYDFSLVGTVVVFVVAPPNGEYVCIDEVAG